MANEHIKRHPISLVIVVVLVVQSLNHVRLLQPYGLESTRLLYPWDFPDKSTEVSCHFLLQGIFPTQGWNLGLPHCRQMLNRLSHKGSLLILPNDENPENFLQFTGYGMLIKLPGAVVTVSNKVAVVVVALILLDFDSDTSIH